MQRSEIIRFLILRNIGNFLVLFALLGLLATFGQALYYEVQFRVIQARGITYTVTDGQKTSPLGEVLKRQEQILIPKDTDFSILIPRIGASAKVFPNIDPTNEKEYQKVLQEGIAHAKGTSFPGLKSSIYLFAHSADNFWNAGRYNAIFYLLKDLKVGDEVVIFFENRRYNYVVSESKIVDSSDVSFLIQSQELKEEKLILQTCWPPGTTWKRLIVIARPK